MKHSKKPQIEHHGGRKVFRRTRGNFISSTTTHKEWNSPSIGMGSHHHLSEYHPPRQLVCHGAQKVNRKGFLTLLKECAPCSSPTSILTVFPHLWRTENEQQPWGMSQRSCFGQEVNGYLFPNQCTAVQTPIVKFRFQVCQYTVFKKVSWKSQIKSLYWVL